MALTPAALAGADQEGPMPRSLFSGDPVVRVGRRFLPVAAAALPPIADRDGLVAVPLAPGTPVHAMEAGRVVSAEGATAGEIVIRIESELRLVYRKLLPSSVTVAAGDMVVAGDVIGTVAPSSGDRLVTLELGVQNPDSSWETLSSWLTGLPDPLELYLRPPGASRPVAERAQAAPVQDAGFTVVKAHPDEPEPEPTQQPEPEAKAEPELEAPAPEEPEPATGISPSGPDTTELEIARPEPGPEPEPEPEAPEPEATEPASPATGASALTSRRRSRGRPARPAPKPAGEAPGPAPAADPEPQPEPAAPTGRHMLTAPEPEPADRPEPRPETEAGEAQHMLTVREPEPAGEPEPEPHANQAEPTPEVTVSVPDATGAEPNAEKDGDDAQDSDTSRASKASRLTSRRQRPKRSRP